MIPSSCIEDFFTGQNSRREFLMFSLSSWGLQPPERLFPLEIPSNEPQSAPDRNLEKRGEWMNESDSKGKKGNDNSEHDSHFNHAKTRFNSPSLITSGHHHHDLLHQDSVHQEVPSLGNIIILFLGKPATERYPLDLAFQWFQSSSSSSQVES